jgi:hypothetical protein
MQMSASTTVPAGSDLPSTIKPPPGRAARRYMWNNS